jgi:hypothetical protein
LVALALDNSLTTVEKLATGKDLITKSCTNCHDLQDFLYISDWKHMKTCKITLTEKEKQMMVDFLSSLATFEVKINSAHKTLDQWHETVNKMAVKSAGTFTKEEIDVILVFLAMEQGIR